MNYFKFVFLFILYNVLVRHSLCDCHHETNKTEEIHKKNTTEEIHKINTTEENRGTNTTEEIHKTNTTEENHGTSTTEKSHETNTTEEKLHNNNENFNIASNDLKLLCYYGSWSVYRPGDGKFPVENIDPFLCSHIIYAFAGLSYDNRIKSLDPYYDLEENYGKGAFKRFNNLKKVNTNLKTLIAIGGWNEGSIKYSNMASQPEARRTFVSSVVEFIGKYDFDGLDLDWEYPAARGGKPEDKNNYVALLRELKEAFKPHGYLLTAAVSAGKWFIDPAYDIPEVSKYLDFINVMCYDYHGGWENKTGHNAPMYPRPDESDTDRISNVNFSINYWLARGAPKDKIILGMGTYGRSFTLQRSEENILGSFAPQKGQAGPYTREAGSLGYNEICEMKMRENWIEVRDPYHLAPYIVKDRQWVGYDDVASISLKASYAKAMRLGGGMIWSIETDDFLGKCHGEKYPLLKAINKAFVRDTSIPTPQPTSRPEDNENRISSTTSRSTWGSTRQTPPSTSTRTWQTSTRTWQTSTPRSISSSDSSVSTVKPTRTTTKWPWAQTHPWSSSTHWSSSTSSSVSTDSSDTPNSGLVCRQPGMQRHQHDCRKFFQCVQSDVQGKYRIFEYTCPDETVFDIRTKSCTWPANVPECSKKVVKKFF